MSSIPLYFRARRRHFTSIVASTILLVACQDLPTSERISSPPASTTRVLQLGLIAAPCTASNFDRPTAQWRISRTTIFFPRSEAASDGRTRPYVYTLYGTDGRRIGMVDCEIPASEAAALRMDRQFGVKRSRSEPTVMNIRLEPIIVNACQNGNPWPDCNTDNTAPPPPSPTQCTILTCVDGGGGGSSGGDGGPVTDDRIEEDEIPDCTKPQTEHSNRAYCESQPVSGEALVKVNDSLARLTLRGGECANIASFGYQLIARQKFRTYPYREEYGNVAGWGSPEIGALLIREWFDRFQSGDPNLIAKIMHEIEHAMGRMEHVTVNGYPMSRNEYACAY